ncbi:hypothetical protein EUX98_g9445, partial [Antrodiella citrinella]
FDTLDHALTNQHHSKLDEASRLFARAQANPESTPSVPYASDARSTMSVNAILRPSGTARRREVHEHEEVRSPTQREHKSASTGNCQEVVLPLRTYTSTSALAVERRVTELKRVIAHREAEPLTPLKADAWEHLLRSTGLLQKYPSLPHSLRHGFDAGIPYVSHTYTPRNAPMPGPLADAFATVVATEFERGRYIGPFSASELQSVIGPFQSSPVSIQPKPNKPGKFRLVQNFSHPHVPSRATPSIHSINSYLDSDLFPCTWGTFNTICTIIHSLPSGSQAAVRDVAEAYRTIPLAASQWPGTVVRLDSDTFAIDSSNPFGLSPAGGLFGQVADAGKDLFLAHGIGPVSKWVDDHIFFRIPREHIEDYNTTRREWASVINENGGVQQEGGRLWYRGLSLPDGRVQHFDEDMSFPLRDLFDAHSCSIADAPFSYSMADINRVSATLGYPWQLSKDIPFCSDPVFIGFTWDLSTLTVALTTDKQKRYYQSILDWEAKATHNQEDVQKLYGKLLHAALIQPAGRAYLTGLERMLGVFHHSPFLPRTQPKGTAEDLRWWKRELACPTFSRLIPGPCAVTDCDAFSDASSGFGIGITIGNQWRAWHLLPGWNTDQRDIGWAESVGFLFLVLTLIPTCTRGGTYQVYGDNQGVVEGWRSGRSRNGPTNNIFKLVHTACVAVGIHVIARYVPSKSNPADAPSRGVYSAKELLLRPIVIPPELHHLIVDFDDNFASASRGKHSAQPDGSENHSYRDSTSGSYESVPTAAPDFNILASPDRPLCPAEERIRKWIPAGAPAPSSIVSLDQRDTTLRQSEIERNKDVAIAAYAVNTLKLYGTGILIFEAFCDRSGISRTQRTPATSTIMITFVACIAGSYSGSAIRNYFFGIRAWHLVHGLPWTMNEDEITVVLRGAERLAPLSSKRKKRQPYTVEYMVKLVPLMNRQNPLDAAVLACLLTIFWSGSRVGEFTIPNLKAFKPATHIQPGHVHPDRDRQGNKVTTFFIPWTKCVAEGETVSWARQEGILDPEAALLNHMHVNEPPNDGPLFAYRDKTSHRGLTKRCFIKRLHEIAKSAGLEPLQGHGIRIGSTLEYLMRGLPFDAVKLIGRWASQAFELYLRKHAQVLAPYLQAKPELHTAFIRQTMPAVR